MKEWDTNLTEVDLSSGQREFVSHELVLADEIGNKLPRRLSRKRDLVGSPTFKAQMCLYESVVLNVIEKLQSSGRLLEWSQHVERHFN